MAKPKSPAYIAGDAVIALCPHLTLKGFIMKSKLPDPEVFERASLLVDRDFFSGCCAALDFANPSFDGDTVELRCFQHLFCPNKSYAGTYYWPCSHKLPRIIALQLCAEIAKEMRAARAIHNRLKKELQWEDEAHEPPATRAWLLKHHYTKQERALLRKYPEIK